MRFKASSPRATRARVSHCARLPHGACAFPNEERTGPAIGGPYCVPFLVWLLTASTWACAASGPVLPDAPSADALVRAYYGMVLADKAPPVASLERELRRLPGGDRAFVEPIGWTASGVVFANVIDGVIDLETALMPISPRAPSPEGRSRSLGVYTIRQTTLPDYFGYIGESRPGFASIIADRVWLDRRVTEDIRVLASTLWHEYQHVRDRRHYRRLTPAVLEARGAVRELSTGLAVADLLRRLASVRAGGEESGPYREAAVLTLDALALALGTATADPDVLAAFGDEAVASAADALAVLAGL